MKLYELSDQLQQAMDLLEDQIDHETGEIIPGDYEAAEELLHETQESFDRKALDVACAIKSFSAEADAINDEIKRLTQRKRSAENKARWLKCYLSNHIDAGPKYSDARANIGWRKSTAVEVDEAQLPEDEQYWRVKREVNRSAIADLLKQGQTVPGAELVVRENISIR